MSRSQTRGPEGTDASVRTTFREVMEGTIRLTGEPDSRTLRLELAASMPGLLHPRVDAVADATGRVLSPGWIDDPAAVGTIHIAPRTRRRLRYQLDFSTTEGQRLHLDGWKSVSDRHPLASMTTLPVTLTDDDGAVVAEGTLRFDLRRQLPAFAASFRLERSPRPARGLGTSRWRGQPGRLEVWYTTLTDPATGAGVWIHHELVAPSDGAAAFAHGWAAVFRPGAAPEWARFGPDEWRAPPEPVATDPDAPVFVSGGVELSDGHLRGTAGDLAWDLTQADDSGPLFTFPRWAWEREVLPAAHVVTHPTATYSGTIRTGAGELVVTGAPGASARIYGHGNAQRWTWLHADLGGGDVLEVVAAVSRRPLLRRLPPLAFLRMRVDGREWPVHGGVLTALRLRTRIDRPTWTVRGRIGARRIVVEVTQPPAETVDVDYADPDGAPAVCHNTERADALIRLERRRSGSWQLEREWRLAGTAHAEVGTREH
jgi:hypothetical protein